MQGRIFVTMALLLVVAEHSRGATLTPLPDLSNGKPLWEMRLVDDGQSIVGVAGDEIFRWTATAGRVVLGHLPLEHYATAISADGTAVLSAGPAPPDGGGAFRWTAATGLVNLGRPVGYPFAVQALSLSRVGSVIFGRAHDGQETIISSGTSLPTITYNYAQFRWTPETGIQLIDLPGGATVASSNGSKIAGARRVADNQVETYLWTQESGVIDLGDFPGGAHDNHPVDMSADGSTIVGDGNANGSLARAYRWTEATGMQSLAPIGDQSRVVAIAGSGNAIIGDVTYLIPGEIAYSVQIESFYWDSTHGARLLRDALAAQGLNLGEAADGHSHRALGISYDGLTILGRSDTQKILPGGLPVFSTAHWIAHLVPEPYGLAPALGALIYTVLLSRPSQRRPRAGFFASCQV
jgi:hypothetical protein